MPYIRAILHINGKTIVTIDIQYLIKYKPIAMTVAKTFMNGKNAIPQTKV